MYKQYKHILYSLTLNDVHQFMSADIFERNNKEYAWKSIEELEMDANVMAKNDDIIAFVKTKCK